MKKLFVFACLSLLLLVSTSVSAADFWPAHCIKPISIGQTINGTLSTSSACYDYESGTDRWYDDVYTFTGTAGQKIAITMNGVGNFDPYLSLYLGNTDDLDNWIAGDDDGGGGVNARIPADAGYITLPSTGTYFIWAATIVPNTGGSYTLTLSSDSASAVKEVIEYYHNNLDHYFMTADPNEAAGLDANPAWGWLRTGNTFKSGGSTPVCRFYGSMSPGPNSHFYTLAGAECDSLKQLQAATPATQKRWNFESLDFYSTPQNSGVCPSGTSSVYRAYNNGYARGIDSNHRITSSQTAIQEVVARNWSNEGVVMCAPAGSSGASTGTFSSDSGGTLTTASGQRLEVPPGAIPLNTSGQATTLTFTAEAVSTPPKPLPIGTSALGQVAKFGPEGVNFAWPVFTTLPIPSSATSLTGLQYKRYVPATARWVSYPGLAYATDSSDRVIGASVASYDLGYDSLAMLNTSPTADVSVAAQQSAPIAAQQPRRRSANVLKRAIILSADLPENRLGSATSDGAMKWVGEKCPTNGFQCHYYFVAKSYKPNNAAQQAAFEAFLTDWYNQDLNCPWNAITERFEAIGDGYCAMFRTSSESASDPAPSTLFGIRQGVWEFCTTASEWVIPGGTLPLPGKWSYSKLVPISITAASLNTCQVTSCWSNVVDIKLPFGGEWKDPWAMTPCPASSLAPAPTTVIISPVTATIGTGATQAFTATVSGATSTTVTWSVQEGATGGTVSSTGLYTAPTVAGTYHVVATSQADTSKKAVATITVTAPVTVAVTVSPTTASIETGATQTFTALVSGSANQGVTWTASGGTISSAGLYTAPTAAGTYYVTATSQADTSKKAVATITVTAPVTVAVTVSPTTASIETGATQTFTALVSGSTNQGVTWTASGGTISSAGLYTAPTAAGTYYVTATSQADTSKKAVATITVTAKDCIYDPSTMLCWDEKDNLANTDWPKAGAYCAGKGRRLPTIEELVSFASEGKAKFSTLGYLYGAPTNLFPRLKERGYKFSVEGGNNQMAGTWSSTIRNEKGYDGVWDLYLLTGLVDSDPQNKYDYMRARCVR